MASRLPLQLRTQMIAVAQRAYQLARPSPTATRIPALAKRQNIFIIRSGTPDLFKSCVAQVQRLAPRAHLHILTHQRDAALVQATCAPSSFTHHAYTAGGSYSWDNIAPMAPQLQAARLDTFIMLTNSPYGYPHIAHILYNLGAQQLHIFNINYQWLSIARSDYEVKTAYDGVYRSICHAFYTDSAR